MSRLKGRIAIVTGAASGLGLATSKRFAAEGATVVMVDRREDAVRQAAEECGQGLDPIAADITKSADLAALRDHVATTYGPADVLFANAGIATFAPFGEVTEDAFDRTVATNLKGTFFNTPLGRPGQPDDISAAALYLASDDSAFVTGIELLVDGGYAQV
jgi:NAD(P)-dependent dehydrogenase (short-subunit alcohol dehydrogenase family)